MKNKFLFVIFISFLIFLTNVTFADNLYIESKNLLLDKNKKVSIFENEVFIRTENNSTITSEYAEYNKESGLVKLKKKVVLIDIQNNKVQTEYAEYDENLKVFKSIGPTKIITTEKYIINGEDIILDNNKKEIKSEKAANVTDLDNNKIYLNNFEYQTENNIFKSIGYIKIEDKMENNYEFSQLYIDTKKREILGTDIKAFMNQNDFKINKENKPRIFSNTMSMDDKKSSFNKSVFTLCDYRKDDKCPPWAIQATKMLHDREEKTIYYDNALLKVYNIPIFYFPKLSHPDPTVDRRTGFLVPSFENTKNLGTGMAIPYFFAIDRDKNFTLNNRIYATENPLFMGEYHQAFKNSNFLADFGFTEGYKKTSKTKKAGDKTHFFSKFVKNFKGKNNSENSLSFSVQNVSDDKYLKLYKLKSDLIDYNTDILENSLNFSHETDNIFLGFNASAFETLKSSYEDKYEYILPEITVDRNLLSNNKFGNLNLQTNYKTHKYDTNKLTNFLVNDFDWNFKDTNFDNGLKGKLLGIIKNVNYETKNVDLYKKDTTNELYGAIGYLTEISLQKNQGKGNHLLKPKMLVRYSPGNMRKELGGTRLSPGSAFSLNRVDNINNFETGLSSTLGFDYKFKKLDKELDFSLAQVINEKENKKMPTKTSLDEKLSDLTGSTQYKINKNINLNYNFSIDQNYNELNYNEIGTSMNFDPIKVDFNYLQEDKHIGNQEYIKTKIDFTKNKNGIFSFETKRNLIKNSSEFYNLSYEYINDCLRAGLVYRREFYNDSELEPENSLMFKITLTPFGDVNALSFKQ